MAPPSEHAFAEPPAVVRLRMLHRCLMCHKHCLIPCSLTASEFEQMLRDELDTVTPEAEDVRDLPQ